MTLCSVFHCESSADEEFRIEDPEASAIPVCGTHKDALDAGADWVLDEQDSDPARLLLGNDVPWRVLAISPDRSRGSVNGLMLRLTLSQMGTTRDLRLVVPWSEVDILKEMLDS